MKKYRLTVNVVRNIFENVLVCTMLFQDLALNLCRLVLDTLQQCRDVDQSNRLLFCVIVATGWHLYSEHTPLVATSSLKLPFFSISRAQFIHVHCKKKLESLAQISALKNKTKNRMSLSLIQPITELFKFEKNAFFLKMIKL
jgi:hypothetical protein